MLHQNDKLKTDSVWIKSHPPSFLPLSKKRALSSFSLITYQVKITYQNSKYIIKRNRSKGFVLSSSFNRQVPKRNIKKH